MVQFKCPRFIHPLVSFTIGVYLLSALFPACKKRDMLHLAFEKVEISSRKIDFVDCKWSNLDVHGSFTLCCHSLLWFILECTYCMHGKSTDSCTPDVINSKRCVTLGNSNWTICSPHNLFSMSKFPLFHKSDAAFPFPACKLSAAALAARPISKWNAGTGNESNNTRFSIGVGER